MEALPPLLARRGRTLIDAVEAVIVSPRSVALTEQQRAEARDIVRKLVEGIEIDLQHFLSPLTPEPPHAWKTIAARGLPVEGLARLVLARALEHGLEEARAGRSSPVRVPAWMASDAELVDLWMRYIVADRRRRDSWSAPIIVVADLPVEMQAALTECVAGALLARRADRDVQIDRYADAFARVIALYREETGIGIASARLIDAALTRRSAPDLIDDLIVGLDWPAIITLISRFSGLDQSDTAIFLCSATCDEIVAWLAPTGLGERPIAALCQAIEMAGGPQGDGREGFAVDPGRGAKSNDPSPVKRILSLAELYCEPSQ